MQGWQNRPKYMHGERYQTAVVVYRVNGSSMHSRLNTMVRRELKVSETCRHHLGGSDAYLGISIVISVLKIRTSCSVKPRLS